MRNGWVNKPGLGRYCYADDVLHCETGPAVHGCDGTVAYYCRGVLHRDDGPAIVWANGDQEFWRDGKQILQMESELVGASAGEACSM